MGLLWYIISEYGWIPLVMLAVVGLIYRYQRNLLYYPRSEPRLPPSFPWFTEHTIPTPDGCLLEAHWATPPQDHPSREEGDKLPTVVFFCGNAGNPTHRFTNVERVVDWVGVNVLLVGYRGYGRGTGNPTQEGLEIDGKAALDWLLEAAPASEQHPAWDPSFDRDNIFVFGRSLGGAVAVSLASDPRYGGLFRGLILENTFTSIPDMVDVVFPIFKPLKFLCTEIWPSSQRIPSVQHPILFLSSSKDELVPSAHLERLFELADQASFKRLVKFTHGEHMNLWTFPGYYQYLREFIQTPHPPLDSFQESSSHQSN